MSNKKNKKQKASNLIDQLRGLSEAQKKFKKTVRPIIREIKRQNLNNIRNAIIVSGTLVTISLIILNSENIIHVIGSKILLNIAIIGFLFSILFYSLLTKKILEKSANRHKENIDEQLSIIKKGKIIITKAFEGKYKEDQMNKRLEEEVFPKLLESITEKEDDGDNKNNSKVNIIKFYSKSGNLFYIISIVSLILSISIQLLINII